MAAETLRFRRQGRSRTAIATVGLIWSALILAFLLFDASVWILAFLAAFTLPAIFELITNPEAGLELDDARIRWFSGKREAQMRLDEIDRLRLDTRLDFSVRATLVPHHGRRIRLPYECTPPADVLEQAFSARGMRTERHHFSLTG